MVGFWVETAGPVGAMIAFMLGALAILPIAYCYSELATMLPYPGGDVVYAYESFGPGVAFIVGWSLLCAFIVSVAFEAIAVGWLLTILFPSIKGPVLYSILDADVTLDSIIIAFTGMCIIGYVNFCGGKLTAKVQDIFTCLLIFACILFITAGVWGGDSNNLEPLFQLDTSGAYWSGIAIVFISTPHWFGGIVIVPQAMCETRDVQERPKLISIAVFLSIVVALLFYLGVILSVGFAVPRDELIGAELGAATALGAALNSSIILNITLLAGLLGLITSWNAFMFAGARLLYALSHSHIISTKFAVRHTKYDSPHIAIIFVMVVGFLLALSGRNCISPMLNVIAVALMVVFLCSSISVVRLRKLLPERARPVRMPFYPWSAISAIVLSVCFLVFAMHTMWQFRTLSVLPLEWIVLLCWIVLGLVIWVLSRSVRVGITEDQRRIVILAESH